ncbi:hypothetical protein HG536_0E03560 [Torulaspora globosa]|uniref:Uncharacterized protein n=1 Tax=Torulaspora globosa TaxID=48254 RepID=A0A7G3ZIV9_9SACH|nr:uncharacterized protein HG536_0E03560 [Torulaspora globosa]QLL33445.1 hypothetical protein HG536_0E03560 [Torulaspora globosa]
MAGVTNTIIVTSNADNVLDKTEPLKRWLSDKVLTNIPITSRNPVEMVVLRDFQRVMIISPTREASQEILRALQNGGTPFCLAYAYSQTDTCDRDSPDYLTVPKSEKMFLISPPSSPPPEFDYARCEQPPPPSHVQGLPHAEGSEFLTLLDNKIASIALQLCDTEQPPGPRTSSYRRTARPPQSSRPPGGPSDLRPPL